MKIRNGHPVLALLVAAMWLAGCSAVPLSKSWEEARKAAAAARAQENQRVADVALGKQAEIVAQGDLARNGLEQVLAVNRFAEPRGGTGPGNSSGTILITRAAILEQENGKWIEVLRCDEHLANPSGYLGGSPTAPAAGWLLELNPRRRQGLELRFTPVDAARIGSSRPVESEASNTVVVQWNARVKRYQSFDRSHGSYLNEAPALEIPRSILR